MSENATNSYTINAECCNRSHVAYIRKELRCKIYGFTCISGVGPVYRIGNFRASEIGSDADETVVCPSCYRVRFAVLLPLTKDGVEHTYVFFAVPTWYGFSHEKSFQTLRARMKRELSWQLSL